VISEIDPCPSGSGQDAIITFTATNSVTSTTRVSTYSDGTWDGSYHLMIPTTAANGIGTITGACKIRATNVVTKTYDSQQYSVLGEPAYINISRDYYNRGETLFIEPQEDCPAAGTFTYVIPSNATLSGSYSVEVFCNSESRSVNYVPMNFGVSAAPQYVVLGDSYSSGESAGDYTARSGNCHRSPHGYAAYVATEQSTGTPTLMACSGAITADYYEKNRKNSAEPAQQTALQSATQLVTMTMGGNDAGFAPVISACVHRPGQDGFGCKYDSVIVSNLYDRIDALGGIGTAQTDEGRDIYALADLYIDIATRASNAKVFIGGYPRLFGPSIGDYNTNSAAPSGYGCVLTPGAVIDYDDAQWLNQVANDLNAVIYDAVTAAQTAGKNVYYVSPALFTTHRLCDSGAEWINGVFLDGVPVKPTQESMHPNADGYEYGYGHAFDLEIDANS
jgi:lysophospholipase L1-like esterase